MNPSKQRHNNQPPPLTINKPAGLSIGVLRPPMPWHKELRRGDGSQLVICLHGLWRSMWAMDPIAQKCAAAGFSSLNIPYPSFTESLDEMAERLAFIVEREASRYDSIHLVTHSLGGVIARRYLTQQAHTKLQRVVMLAPPLQGSRIIDWVEESPLGSIFGPAQKFLCSEEMKSEPDFLSVPAEVAVIMGNKIKIPLMHRLIGEESDGIVRVNAGRVPGLKDFKIVAADHTLITVHPDVLVSVTDFINDGKF